MDVTESSEPTPSFPHLLGLILEAITAYLLVGTPFLPELSCPSTHQRRRPLSPNYIRMIINLLLTSLSSWLLLLLPVYACLRRLHSQSSPLPLIPHSREVPSSRLSRNPSQLALLPDILAEEIPHHSTLPVQTNCVPTTMSFLYPRQDTLKGCFASPFGSRPNKAVDTMAMAKPTRYQARPEFYGAFSTVDDVKGKAKQLSAEATAEFEKASAKAQSAAGGKIELYSGKYYAACTVGGLMACGLTHTAVTPLDLVKVRRQIDSKLYRGNFQAWGMIFRKEGLRGIMTGWGPTFWGYSAQGACKYGFYEYFKKTYADLAGPDNAKKYQTILFLSASASAEFLADIALCPFEAVKVRMQGGIPSPYKGTLDGISKVTAKEGWGGLYKGLYPLWGRQIPYTMMKFASFETIVEMMYARLPGQKSDYSKAAQTGVSFVSGYLAGILCAIVSHPADVMVSKLNANRAQGEAFGAAMGRIYKDIGFSGLWNGLPVRIVMIGTLTGLQWMIYDYFKIFMGFPTTGGAAPPAEKK